MGEAVLCAPVAADDISAGLDDRVTNNNKYEDVVVAWGCAVAAEKSVPTGVGAEVGAEVAPTEMETELECEEAAEALERVGVDGDCVKRASLTPDALVLA